VEVLDAATHLWALSRALASGTRLQGRNDAS